MCILWTQSNDINVIRWCTNLLGKAQSKTMNRCMQGVKEGSELTGPVDSGQTVPLVQEFGF